MTPFRILLIGLFLVAVAMYALNPGPDKFERFLRIDMAERAEAAAQDAGIGDIGGGMGSFLANRIGREIGSAISPVFERENYVVASVYRVDVNGDGPGGKWAFLGVANWFIPLEQPEAVDGQ